MDTAILKTAVAMSHRGFESLSLRQCDLSGHTGRLSQDMVDVLSGEGLVVAAGIDGQRAQQGAVLREYPHLGVSDQDRYPLALVGLAHGDVTKAAQVAEGDPALLVDAVATDPEVDWGLR